MSTYFTDVIIPIKLYHLDVDIPNTNETEGMSTYKINSKITKQINNEK